MVPDGVSQDWNAVVPPEGTRTAYEYVASYVPELAILNTNPNEEPVDSPLSAESGETATFLKPDADAPIRFVFEDAGGRGGGVHGWPWAGRIAASESCRRRRQKILHTVM